ncbi:MAG: hypothetical protein HY907_14600 [Deltaproteobacteria bacterium]|nr:hypothetical protein [Deltaproteobacteria bacterium]
MTRPTRHPWSVSTREVIPARTLTPAALSRPLALAFLLLLPLAACGGIVAGEGDSGAEVSDADHGGGDVEVLPDVHDVRPDDHATGDADAVEDVAPEDTVEVTPECTGSGDCDDGEPCNGAEACVDSSCVEGEAPGEGSACTTPDVEDGVCRGGLCALSSCGDWVLAAGEECDDGNLFDGDGCESDCQFSCHGNTECNDAEECTLDACSPGGFGRLCTHETRADGDPCSDANPCTVEDRCTGGVCGGEIRNCEDGDRCTVDSCDTTGPATDPCVHEPLPDWYLDEDGDTWGDPAAKECGYEAPGDAWVDVAGDCCDGNVNVHPDQRAYFPTPYVCAGGTSHSFDYDCNGSAERQFADAATGCVGGGCLSCSCTAGWCPSGWPDPLMGCIGVPTCGSLAGWVTSCAYSSSGTLDGGTTDGGTTDGGTPEGGSSDAYADASSDTVRDDALVDASDGGSLCIPIVEPRTQACR